MGDVDPDWTAVILSGGRSTRLGQDKATATLDGRTLLDHVVDAIPADVTCIVVGRPPASASRLLIVAIEAEPDGGPVAGVECGIAFVRTPIVLIHAVDMPFTRVLLARLLVELRAAAPEVDAVVPVDASGRRQPLVAVYRTEAVRDRLADLDPVRGRAMRDLLAALNVIELPLGDHDPRALLDIDTAADLDAARRTVTGDDNATTEETPVMDEWVAAASKALDIDIEVDVDVSAILDVARDAAHAVERPAAPVTTYLLGYAVANGMTAEDAAERISTLARDWPSAT